MSNKERENPEIAVVPLEAAGSERGIKFTEKGFAISWKGLEKAKEGEVMIVALKDNDKKLLQLREEANESKNKGMGRED